MDEQFVSENNLFAIDSYVTLDAAAFYDFQAWRFRLNLKKPLRGFVLWLRIAWRIWFKMARPFQLQFLLANIVESLWFEFRPKYIDTLPPKRRNQE